MGRRMYKLVLRLQVQDRFAFYFRLVQVETQVVRLVQAVEVVLTTLEVAIILLLTVGQQLIQAVDKQILVIFGIQVYLVLDKISKM